jgi:hypothetical protein
MFQINQQTTSVKMMHEGNDSPSHSSRGNVGVDHKVSTSYFYIKNSILLMKELLNIHCHHTPTNIISSH